MKGKTAEEVISDLVSLLKRSGIEQEITGKVYRDDLRPKDSRLEDITVHFITGLSGEVETGVAALNAYIAPKDLYDDGVLRKDTKRVMEIQRLLADWLASTPAADNYLIESENILTGEYDHELKQHYINVRLRFQYFD